MKCEYPDCNRYDTLEFVVAPDYPDVVDFSKPLKEVPLKRHAACQTHMWAVRERAQRDDAPGRVAYRERIAQL